MNTTTPANQPEESVNPCADVVQPDSANSEKEFDSTEPLSPRQYFVQKVCYNPDPEICFRNLLKLTTNTKSKLFDFEVYLEFFAKIEFDKMLGIDIERYRMVFKKYYHGFSRKFNPKKAKHSDLYGPEAFMWTVEHYLTEKDYRFKKQKIKAEEFCFIAYLLTDLCLKNDDFQMVHRNFFLGKKDDALCFNVQRYRKYTGRRLNSDKLNYIITVLTRYNLIIEEKLGVKGKTHLRNFYSVGANNPYYGYVLPVKQNLNHDNDLDA